MTRGPCDVVVAGTIEPTVGGIATAIHDQVTALRQAGLRVEAFNTGRMRRARPGRATLQNLGAACSDAWRLAVGARRRNAPVVDVHTVGSPLLPLLRALALVVAARAAGARAVVHLHGYDLHAVLERSPRPYVTALRALAALSGGMVTFEQRIANSLRRCTPSVQVVVIPNCIDCGPDSPAAADTARPAEAGLRIVFVGTVGRRKGVADLLYAIRQLDDEVGCDIVGGGAEEGNEEFERLRSQASDLVASGRASFHGELSRPETRAILQQASIFVLPSYAEGMPIALLEAMSCGLPAVVTDTGAMGDVVREAGCGIVVERGDGRGLARALQELVSDPHRRSTLGQAARAAVRARYCCEQAVPELVRLYHLVSADRSPRGGDARRHSGMRHNRS